jgi:3-phenylpropionate/trans-cinnamate dioxygenase ferredoxin reductase component
MHIAIIGNGISGITAARVLRHRSDTVQITVISAESDYFFSRTALMYVYMGQLRLQDTQPYENWFWEKNRIALKRTKIQSIDTATNNLLTSSGERIAYDKLIIATGSKPNKFGWPGQDLQHVQGLYSLQDLEAMEQGSAGLQRAVIVGGGLIGIEMAEMFHSRQIPVTFLVRESSFWNGVLPPAESDMVNRHIREHGIDLRLNTELKTIEDDGTGKVGAIVTNQGERIACGYVGLTAGVSPNIDFLAGSGIEVNRGVLVNDFLTTNVPNVYAIGDCAELQHPAPGRRAIEAVWYTGRMMGETVAYNILGKPVAYQPGIWFNSAKFFDIEYQVYGSVEPVLPPEQASVYWEHPAGRKSIRVVYDRVSNAVLGFNLMGIRYRQEVCERWISQKTPLETVLQNLGLANFDPEFFDQYEQALLNQYTQQTGKPLVLRQKRGLSGVLQFLNKR